MSVLPTPRPPIDFVRDFGPNLDGQDSYISGPIGPAAFAIQLCRKEVDGLCEYNRERGLFAEVLFPNSDLLKGSASPAGSIDLTEYQEGAFRDRFKTRFHPARLWNACSDSFNFPPVCVVADASTWFQPVLSLGIHFSRRRVLGHLPKSGRSESFNP
jgi:hypothetical protein